MNKIHEGHNVKRFREMLRIKQDALAASLGDDWNQKKVSLLEQKESIEPAILDQVAQALKVPVDAIKNFTEEKAVMIITNNTFENLENSPVLQGQQDESHQEINTNNTETMMQMFEKIMEMEKERTEMIKDLMNRLAK